MTKPETAALPLPGLRTVMPRGSLLILSGLVGLGTLTSGCAGLPLQFQDRLGDDADSLPSWAEIVESEKVKASEMALDPGANEFTEGRESRYGAPEEANAAEERSTSVPAGNLSEILFGKSRAPASVSDLLPDEVRLGMTEDEVMAAWGEPREVEVARSGAAGAHRFIYPTSVLPGIGEERIVYFEGGRVAGWETVRR